VGGDAVECLLFLALPLTGPSLDFDSGGRPRFLEGMDGSEASGTVPALYC
jgi:hypothetical protein